MGQRRRRLAAAADGVSVHLSPPGPLPPSAPTAGVDHTAPGSHRRNGAAAGCYRGSVSGRYRSQVSGRYRSRVSGWHHDRIAS